jgi:hypothetical protein
MRGLGLVAVTLVALRLGASPALAESPQDPVRAVYRSATAPGERASVIYDKAVTHANFSASFEALVADIDKRQQKSGEEILDFDPVLSTNGDVGAENLAIKSLSSGETQAMVEATFGKGKDRRSVVYVVRKENGEWRIDDIRSRPGAKGVEVWSVRKISADDLKPAGKN